MFAYSMSSKKENDWYRDEIEASQKDTVSGLFKGKACRIRSLTCTSNLGRLRCISRVKTHGKTKRY